jgi:hypothetical protein
MKTLKIYFCVITLIFLFSCENIDKQSLKIIDNVVLGVSQKEFNKSCDSLGIKEAIFETKLFIEKNDNLKDIALKFNYTERFNIGDFCGKNNSTIGLFYPIENSGTDNIIGLKLLLANKSKPTINNPNIDSSTKESIYFIHQDLNENLISDIKNLFITKYGTPKTILEQNNFLFQVIQNNEIIDYRQDSINFGTVYRWETEALIINFFTGIHSKKALYNPSTKYYLLPWIDLEKAKTENYIYCRGFPYIEYRLKNEIIEKLNLNKIKI